MTKNNQMLFRLTSFLTTIILRFSRIYSSKDSNIKPEDGICWRLVAEKTLMKITHRGLRRTFRQAITEAMDVGSDFFGPESASLWLPILEKTYCHQHLVVSVKDFVTLPS